MNLPPQGLSLAFREARLQVELADLDFKASRLVRGRSATGARGTFADAMEVGPLTGACLNFPCLDGTHSLAMRQF